MLFLNWLCRFTEAEGLIYSGGEFFRVDASTSNFKQAFENKSLINNRIGFFIKFFAAVFWLIYQLCFTFVLWMKKMFGKRF